MERFINANGRIVDVLDIDMGSLRDNGYSRIEWRSLHSGRIVSISCYNDKERKAAFQKILDSANSLALLQRAELLGLSRAEAEEEQRLLANQKKAEKEASAAAGAVLLSGLIAAGVAAWFDNQN